MRGEVRVEEDLNSMAPDDLESELQRLQVQKVREEIRELRAAPWRRPAWLASVTTMAAAIIGLMWAISNGYFENRARELRLQTDDLKAGRDHQLRESALEKKRYEAQARELRGRVAVLQRRVAELNVPLVTNALSFTAPWVESYLRGPATLRLSGSGFGKTTGTVQLNFIASTVDHSVSCLRLQGAPTAWEDGEITVEMPGLDVAQLRNRARSVCRAPGGSNHCAMALLIHVIRQDGSASPTRYVEFVGLTDWVLESGKFRPDGRPPL